LQELKAKDPTAYQNAIARTLALIKSKGNAGLSTADPETTESNDS
jgi:hypothetical protein